MIGGRSIWATLGLPPNQRLVMSSLETMLSKVATLSASVLESHMILASSTTDPEAMTATATSRFVVRFD